LISDKPQGERKQRKNAHPQVPERNIRKVTKGGPVEKEGKQKHQPDKKKERGWKNKGSCGGNPIHNGGGTRTRLSGFRTD